jgi:hypothetical protein
MCFAVTASGVGFSQLWRVGAQVNPAMLSALEWRVESPGQADIIYVAMR